MIIDVDRSYYYTAENGDGVNLIFEEIRECLIIDLMNDDRPNNAKVLIFLSVFGAIAYEDFKGITGIHISKEEFHRYAADGGMGYEEAKEYFEDYGDNPEGDGDSRDALRMEELDEGTGRPVGAGRTGPPELTRPDEQRKRSRRNKQGRQGKHQEQGRPF